MHGKRLQITIHSLLITFGIAEHEAITPLKAATLHAPHQLRIKRIGTGGDQHADGTGLIELEATRQRRGGVVEAFDRSVNFGGNRLADKAVLIDDV